MALPEIHKVGFTFYGKSDELKEIEVLLSKKLQSVVEAFSYLSLGIVLTTEINGKTVEVRVDRLEDGGETPIFAGIVPLGVNEFPFEIVSDI